MCSRQTPRHPICHHAAHGTALEVARLVLCEDAERLGSPCQNIPWGSYEVRRGHCDTCIINGERLAQERGLDAGLYSRSMGVSLHALRAAHPAAAV
jgi:hypothetical protein